MVIAGGYLLLTNQANAPQSEIKETPVVTETEEIEAVREIIVSGKDYSFTPQTFTLKSGERVRLNFKNQGVVVHNLVVEGEGISTQTISPGQEDTVEFTTPEAGEYTIFCSVPGHRERGMIGTLTVE